MWPFTGLEPGKYGVIVADPPWHFRARTALQVGSWGLEAGKFDARAA